MASIVFYVISIAVAIAVGVLRHQSLDLDFPRRHRVEPAPVEAIDTAAADATGVARKAA